MNVEHLGYLASVLLIASLMMSDVVKLRWFNLAGCITFTAYGVMIEAWPVAVTNAILTLINVYHLFKMARAKVNSQSAE